MKKYGRIGKGVQELTFLLSKDSGRQFSQSDLSLHLFPSRGRQNAHASAGHSRQLKIRVTFVEIRNYGGGPTRPLPRLLDLGVYATFLAEHLLSNV